MDSRKSASPNNKKGKLYDTWVEYLTFVPHFSPLRCHDLMCQLTTLTRFISTFLFSKTQSFASLTLYLSDYFCPALASRFDMDDSDDLFGAFDSENLYTRIGFIKGAKRDDIILMENANAILPLVQIGRSHDRVEAAVCTTMLLDSSKPVTQTFTDSRVSSNPQTLPLIAPGTVRTYEGERRRRVAKVKREVKADPPTSPGNSSFSEGQDGRLEAPLNLAQILEPAESIPVINLLSDIHQDELRPVENSPLGNRNNSLPLFPQPPPPHLQNQSPAASLRVVPLQAPSPIFAAHSVSVDSDEENNPDLPPAALERRIDTVTRAFLHHLHPLQEAKNAAEHRGAPLWPIRAAAQEWRPTISKDNAPEPHPLVLNIPTTHIEREQYFGLGGDRRYPVFGTSLAERVEQHHHYIHLTLPPAFVEYLLTHMNEKLNFNPPIQREKLYRFFGAQLLMAQNKSMSRKTAFEQSIWGICLKDYISLTDYKRIYHALGAPTVASASMEDVETDIDVIWTYLNNHMRKIVTPGTYLLLDQATLTWRGRNSSWVDGSPLLADMQGDPQFNGFQFNTLTDCASKVILFVEPQLSPESMHERHKKEHPNISHAASAAVARMLNDSGLNQAENRSRFACPRVILGDARFSSLETARVALQNDCGYLGVVGMSTDFPEKQLERCPDVVLQQNNSIPKIGAANTMEQEHLASLSSSSSSSLSSSSSSSSSSAMRMPLASIYVSSFRTADGSPVNFVHTFYPRDVSLLNLYRKYNPAFNGTLIRSNISAESASVVRNYRKKHILALLGMCVTNAFMLYCYEHKNAGIPGERVESCTFSVDVAKHLLEHSF